MTQGAIDLVQAELTPPLYSSLLLLHDKPYLLPKLIATEPTRPLAPAHRVISNYTWWNDGDFVCISLPTLGGCHSVSATAPEQVQCCIGELHVKCIITAPDADGQQVQHRLNLPHLNGIIKPGQSSCLFNGQTVQLSGATTAACHAASQASVAAFDHTSSTAVKDSHSPMQLFDVTLNKSQHLIQPSITTSTYLAPLQHSQKGGQLHLQPSRPASGLSHALTA